MIPVSPPPIVTPFTDRSTISGISRPWVKWMQEVQQTLNKPVPGPYADDAEARTAGVPVGAQYHLASGAVVVRLV